MQLFYIDELLEITKQRFVETYADKLKQRNKLSEVEFKFEDEFKNILRAVEERDAKQKLEKKAAAAQPKQFEKKPKKPKDEEEEEDLGEDVTEVQSPQTPESPKSFETPNNSAKSNNNKLSIEERRKQFIQKQQEAAKKPKPKSSTPQSPIVPQSYVSFFDSNI